ncbi:SDR family NAD(P)-dependent oxidoreductase [Dankookia rubra]|uniref:SDR family NAD(P)-dependent oxidoreductase n=1 Tax=Dankookia rubra TaxID=1442381 RepID=UPI0019D59898|nr:SDR family NAD(P)-dependent oxidoreductase [Dankookia rubra]
MGMLDGKVAIITGGTSGIGAACVELFIAEGAQVVIAARRQVEGEELARRHGQSASFIRTDVAQEADVQAMLAHCLSRFGRLDCLVNNAGTPGGAAGIAEVDIDKFDDLTNVHLRGTLLGMKHAAPVMLKQGHGSIVNLGSVAGQFPGISSHIYSAVKAAIIHLTRCVAMELGEGGVRVNSVSPGAIVTGIFGKGAGMTDAEAARGFPALESSSRPCKPSGALAGQWMSPVPSPGSRAIYLASSTVKTSRRTARYPEASPGPGCESCAQRW